jgi:hypothetical protein
MLLAPRPPKRVAARDALMKQGEPMATRSIEVLATKPASAMEMIAKRAYFKAEARGFAPGHELEDWLAAEREVRDASAETAPTSKKPASRRKNGRTAP